MNRTQPALRAVPSEAQVMTNLPQVSVGLTTLQGFELAQRAAKCLATSTLVPKEYQGNLSNCIIALNMAQRMGADPLMVMQNLYLVHGRPSWSAQFLIATFNQCGRFDALRYEWRGKRGDKDWGCRAYTREKANGERIESAWIDWAMVEAEGWNKRNGSKWLTMPEQMFMYRSASWLVRAYAPELSMGLHTRDEMEDVYDATPTANGSYEVIDQNPIKNENPEPASVSADAPNVTTVIDQETGEIMTATETSEPDQYEDLRLALGECKSISDLSRLIHDLTKEQRADDALMVLVRARQDELKG